MNRHGAAVYRYCREALEDSELACDVRQQVFLEAFCDLPRFAGRSTVRTWLFGIARHRILDAVRKRSRYQARIEVDHAADVVDPRPSPAELLDEARLQALVRVCLGQLNEKVQATLLLRYHQGFTFDQIAKIRGEQAGTVQVRVARALLVLRKRVESHTGMW
jgi:RNA polymerase sigma-70 factor, ECF subfamily